MNERQRIILILSSTVGADLKNTMQEFTAVNFGSSDQYKDQLQTQGQRKDLLQSC